MMRSAAEQTGQKKVIDATPVLMDRDAERILTATYRRPRNVYELSQTYGIPIATCIRKVKRLKRMGLLRVVDTMRTPSGRKAEVYSASLDNAYVYYDSGRLKVRFTVMLQMAEDFRRRFESFNGAPQAPARYQD